MAQPENEISIIHGTLGEFANGFTIRQSAQTEGSSDNTFPRIYHGSPNFPYERVKDFLHQEADIWIEDNKWIVNIEPIRYAEKSVTTSEPKTLLQRFLQLFSR